MTANDDALAAVQATVAELQTDVAALIAAIGTGGPDDISAALGTVNTTLQTLDADVKAATPASTTPPASTDTPPTQVPAGSSDAQVPTVPEAPVSSPEVS